MLGAIMALITLLLPEQLAGIFSTIGGPVVREAVHRLRIAAFSQPFLGAPRWCWKAPRWCRVDLATNAWQHGHYGIAHSCGARGPRCNLVPRVCGGRWR